MTSPMSDNIQQANTEMPDAKPALQKKISIVTCENVDTESPMKVLNL